MTCFPSHLRNLCAKTCLESLLNTLQQELFWIAAKYSFNGHLRCLHNLKHGQYKHHNTWKVLVGITPNGQVSYLSHLWGGRVSDKQITRESGVLDLLEAGDNVMVDRGFDISNIVPDRVTVNMPPFLAGRDQMTAAETEETMSIVSVRIHVERAIGRMKTYHILDGTLPNTLSPYATQIVTVCGLLTNFLPPLLKPADP